MFELKGYKNPVLVASTDSVGTKLRIAIAMGRYDTAGKDIVNHCVNDIFTCGADPLFFLDYIGIGKLVPEKVADVVQGVAEACKEVGCVLIGGETAELRDIYSGDDYDLAGFIIGGIEKENILTGENITVGDVAIGLPSSGLHTNGFTLVRKVLGETKEELEKNYPGLDRSLGEELLEPHRCYYNQLKPLLPHIKGLAHITGGGLIGNVPRVLPPGIGVSFDQTKWNVPPIFELIQKQGNIDLYEMYRVFNMGIGMVVICSSDNAQKITSTLTEALIIGEIVKQTGEERVIIK